MRSSTKPRALSAHTLIGGDVVNQDNEVLGEIIELMIHTASGRIEYAVFSLEQSFSAARATSNNLFAIPWQLLTFQPETQNFVLNVDRKVLKNAPRLDRNHWPAHLDPYWTIELSRYYSQSWIRVYP
ncbi:PRC-barrel domain-containing protein [Caldilinea sp.]|uniref:PRC-barrel domain-containing protein n=1 Tax=Caldilinea sp. TaxID=2293560 RepID=UPI0031CC3DAE